MFSFLNRFSRDKGGASALTFSLAIVPVLAGVGASVDYGRVWRSSMQLQNATDAAALAAASITALQRDSGVTSETLARKMFAATYSGPTGTLTYSETNGVYRVAVTAQLTTTIMGVIGVASMPFGAKSAAVADTLLQPACFMAMHPSRKHTLELKGTVSVYAPECHIYGNSNDEDDVVDPHNPENFLTGKSVQAVGYGHHYIKNVTPPLEYAPKKLDDPLAAMSIPTDTSCTFKSRKISAQTISIDPGVYCNGLTIEKGSNVTFKPGTYFIDNGRFKLNKSTATGEGVTIILADNNSLIEWKDSTIRLAAPKTGSLAGIVITGIRYPANHVMEDSTVDLHGVVYLPKGAFDWTNKGTPTITAKWTAWIIDGVTWDGSGTIKINFDRAGSDIPFPGALNSVIPRPSGTHNPRLTSY